MLVPVQSGDKEQRLGLEMAIHDVWMLGTAREAQFPGAILTTGIPVRGDKFMEGRDAGQDVHDSHMQRHTGEINKRFAVRCDASCHCLLFSFLESAFAFLWLCESVRR